jgi:MATE family multidrug resistance protein
MMPPPPRACSYGTEKATSIRISHHLGAQRVDLAKAVAAIDGVVSFAIAALVAAAILATGPVIGRLFSNDPAVWALAQQLSVPVGAGYFLISIFFVSLGILAGQGRPGAVAAAFVVGAWLVAVPLGVVLTRVAGRGLLGIWDSLTVGYAVISVVAAVAVWRSDWEAAAAAAHRRSQPHAPAAASDGTVTAAAKLQDGAAEAADGAGASAFSSLGRGDDKGSSSVGAGDGTIN